MVRLGVYVTKNNTKVILLSEVGSQKYNLGRISIYAKMT